MRLWGIETDSRPRPRQDEAESRPTHNKTDLIHICIQTPAEDKWKFLFYCHIHIYCMCVYVWVHREKCLGKIITKYRRDYFYVWDFEQTNINTNGWNQHKCLYSTLLFYFFNIQLTQYDFLCENHLQSFLCESSTVRQFCGIPSIE